MSDLWHRTNALFLEALSLPQKQRATFLQSACPSPELHQEVTDMLQAYDQSQRFLDQPALISIPSWHAAIGSTLGAYRIERELGRGGMAVVFQACRTDGAFEKTVAIKFLLSPLPSEFSLRRFSQERQMLARLNHPNIAQLLDGGHTQEGYPYLVMEYIAGETLLEYCAKQQLNLIQRLRLFQEICGAVHFIHQHLIVHRDLKPGNILVDGQGTPKILDFGIAKLLGADVLGSGFTQDITSKPIMTPEYASPEQFRQQQVTTAADTYALGVLLYRLLSGSMPYVVRGRSAVELERKICVEEPTPPSQVATSGPGEGQETPSWRKQLPKDLDYIVSKAMRKDPGRRYSSVLALSEDISRFFEGFPVLARKGHFGYRAAKFFSRHVMAVGFGIGLTLLLTAGISVLAWQGSKTALERDRFQRLNGFLLSIFEFADPMKPQGYNPTAKELMAKASENVEHQLQDDPLVRASMLDSLGQVQYRLGAFPQARKMLEEAYELRYQYLKKTDPLLLSTALILARFRLFVGDLKGAETLLKNHEQQVVGRRVKDPALRGQFWLVSGKLAQEKNDSPQAESHLMKALLYLEADGDLLTSAEVAGDLGTLHFRRENLAIATVYFEQALDLSQRALGEDHPLVAKAMSNLGIAYGEIGAYEKVVELFTKARAIAMRNFGEQHPYVAIATHNLALTYSRLGDYHRALEFMQIALTNRTLAFGELHPKVAATAMALGRIYFQLGATDQAETYAVCSLQTLQETLPPDHLDVAKAALLLAEIYQDTGDFERASKWCDQSLSIMTKKLKPNHGELQTARKIRKELDQKSQF